MVAIIVPEGEVEELAAHITPLWNGPGQISVGLFVPSLKKTKITIRATKGVVVQVNLGGIIDYVAIHGIVIKPHQASLVMVVPGAWQLLIKDHAVTEAVCTLSSILVLGKELTIGPWLNVFGSGARHHANMQNLATASSHTTLVSFFITKCSTVLNSHFGKLPDRRYTPWMLIEFASAVGLHNALVLSGSPNSPLLPQPKPHIPQCPPCGAISLTALGPLTQAPSGSMARSSPSSGPSLLKSVKQRSRSVLLSSASMPIGLLKPRPGSSIKQNGETAITPPLLNTPSRPRLQQPASNPLSSSLPCPRPTVLFGWDGLAPIKTTLLLLAFLLSLVPGALATNTTKAEAPHTTGPLVTACYPNSPPWTMEGHPPHWFTVHPR